MNLRFAFRHLRWNAGFTVVAVIILGLGIGANTALFSIIYSVLLRPLPYPDADRIVVLSTALAGQPGSAGQVSGPDFADWRDLNSAFEAMAAYSGGETGAAAAGAAHYADVTAVTRGFRQVIGVSPALGRWFRAQEEDDAGPPVAVVSHDFAERMFAGDALGKLLRIRDRARVVIGVMPSGFRFPGKTDVWTPSGRVMEHESRTAHNWNVVARLKNGVSLAQSREQMDAIGSQLADRYPKDNRDKRIVLSSLHERLVRDVRPMLLLLFASVALVLLIACVNIANLLLAKASARTKEIAVRTALGAGRGRIVAQLLTESFLVACLGGAAGLVTGVALLKAVVALAPAGLTRNADIRMDPVVLLFAAGVSVASTLVFGLVPALKTYRIDVNDALKNSAGRSTTAPKLPGVLVAGEIGLATMLAVAAGLVIQTFGTLAATSLGFETRDVIVAQVAPMYSPQPEGADRSVRWHRDTAEELRHLPGVVAVAGVVGFPGAAFHSTGGYVAGGGDSDLDKPALFTLITPGYFATLRIALLIGRDFSEADHSKAQFVAIINRALAKQAFSGADPIGRRIQCGLDSDEWMTIIGVSENSRTLGPAVPEQPEIYMPAAQHPGPAQRMSFVIRTAGDPSAMADPIRRMIRQHGPEVPIRLTPLDALWSDNIARPRFRAFVLGAMALLAVLLAMTGMYGVMAYETGLRTAEFGVRMAVGAGPGDIIRMVLGRGAAVALGGLVIGICGAFAAARLLESMIWGVTPRDPATYAGVAIFVLCIALAASAGPAIRSARANPIRALQ